MSPDRVSRTTALLAATALAAPVARAAAQPSVAVRAATQPPRADEAANRLAAATIDRAARGVREARTVRATFEQTLSNPATGNRNVTTGELALGHPNRFAVRFNTPQGDRVVSDGRTLWAYVPSAVPGQVLKQPARGAGAQSVEMLGELLTSPRSKFRVADAGAATIGGRATRAVLLTPKRDGEPLTQARVWVDDRDGAIRQLELTEASGAVRTWRITAWELNARLAVDAFTFKVPPGVRVVDQAAMTGAR